MRIQFKNVLVVAAHPDDEILGCGATLARLKAEGARISVLLMGEGPTARGDGDAVKNEARESASMAARIIGVDNLEFANLPDNRFDTLPLLEITQIVETMIAKVAPDLILTHFCGDMNLDHGLTQRAVMTAARPLPGELKRCVASFEVLSSTEYGPRGALPAFQPDIYVDISDYMNIKIEALKAYASEMRTAPHPRSYDTVRHLAALRGSQCGCNMAEAFMLQKLVI